MDTFKEWVDKLRDCNKLIIVEGKKDKKALENLSIKNIITFSNSPYFLLENIQEKEVVILTDLDYHGKKLYSILKKGLQSRGIKVDNKFREFLFKNSKITNIESIDLEKIKL